jgi:hypothetical protein
LNSVAVLRPSTVSGCPAARLIALDIADQREVGLDGIRYCVPPGSLVLALLIVVIAAASEPSIVTV